ncbi:hypothetical protein [Saccharothrix syringae]|uniref:DUF4253 domain-containing protein n=1 Tax=Saccharothrix syringae TaxID=103733 RepID=A0A5Q0GXW2_SACSY|nr:hypothetical protein [Saccharothrix syringae]QFZ18330.1 hypothetical protein EKG83_13300 [Saccharothrix syringae]
MDVQDVDQRGSRLVDSFSHLRLSGITSLAEVLGVVASLRHDDPGSRYLCTLDDLDQCRYTSAHAREDERLGLWDVEAGESPVFDEACLRLVAERLDDDALRVPWPSLAGALMTAAADVDALVAVNRDPVAVLDGVVYVQRLPLARDDLMIAGLPNGYFSGDWDVFQNHAVIRRLEAVHGYRFFGIGASWLGFVRDAPAGAARVVEDLVHLYGWGESRAWREMGELVRRNEWLLLGYTENFAEGFR